MHLARAAFFLALAAAPRIARAEPDRLAFVEDALARDASQSRLWYFGWTATYTLAVAGNLTLAFVAPDAGMRASSRVGVVTSGLGLVATAIAPPSSLFYSPCGTADRDVCLARQMERLDDTANQEAFAKSVWSHLGGIAVNVGAGLYLWLHDDELGQAILSTVVGIAVGEFQIFTRPTVARDARDALRPNVALFPTRGGAGVAIGASF